MRVGLTLLVRQSFATLGVLVKCLGLENGFYRLTFPSLHAALSSYAMIFAAVILE